MRRNTDRCRVCDGRVDLLAKLALDLQSQIPDERVPRGIPSTQMRDGPLSPVCQSIAVNKGISVSMKNHLTNLHVDCVPIDKALRDV